MKLFLALALVANLSTAVAANDAALPGLRLNGITADAYLNEAVAADNADDVDVDASHHQAALDNQADSSKSAVPKFLRGIQVGMLATTTNINCADVTDGDYKAACIAVKANYFDGACSASLGKLVCFCQYC